MAKVIVVTSGKGGVGKTTTAASFATGLAAAGHRTVVVDFDVGLRNLDLIMGCERRVVFDLINVINDEANLNQALIKDKRTANLCILPASQTRDKNALREDRVAAVIEALSERFDYVVCDSPAGIEHGAVMAMRFADEALIITNPEVSSVRDSDRILGLIASKTVRAETGREPVKEMLIVTRFDPKRAGSGEMLAVADIEDLLAAPLLAVIPESESVLNASNVGAPVILDQGSLAGQAYTDCVRRYLGEDVPHRFMEAKRGFMQRMFRRAS